MTETKDVVPTAVENGEVKNTDTEIRDKANKFALPIIGDESSSDETSEDDNNRPLYGKLPEDLGFTVVGMSFATHDLKLMQKLKLDLDTFIQMSDKEMCDLGFQRGHKMKQLFMNKEYKKNITKYFPRQPKVNLQFSNSESNTVFTGILSETNDITQILRELNMNVYRQLRNKDQMAKNQGDGEALLAVCKTVEKRAEQTQQLLARVSKEVGLTLPVDISERMKKKKKKRPIKASLRLTVIQKAIVIASASLFIILVVKKVILSSVK